MIEEHDRISDAALEEQAERERRIRWLVSDTNGTLRPEEERARFEAADDDTEQLKQEEKLA